MSYTASYPSRICPYDYKKDRTVISRHINNVFKEGELEKEEVCANFAHTTRHGAIEGKQQTQEIVLYNLDVIISVGYRVHSKRGTAFRIWARKIIKDYLVKGYAVNERIRKEQIGELRQLIGMLGRTIQNLINACRACITAGPTYIITNLKN